MLKVHTLVGLSLLTAYAISSPHQQPVMNGFQSGQSVATPSPTPAPWPNLDMLDRFKNPTGSRCGLKGTVGTDPEDAAVNRLRNRYHLPNSFEEVTLESLLELPHGEIASDGKSIIKHPTADSSQHERGITVTGVVTEVVILGCGARSTPQKTLPLKIPGRGVESANCFTGQQDLCNTQIILTPDSNLGTTKGRNLYVVQITERARRLAASGLLVSNIGHDWSINALRKLAGRRVRISGWLFFNPHYRERNWKADPNDSVGKPNRWETAWEVHPVMGIEVDPEPKPK